MLREAQAVALVKSISRRWLGSRQVICSSSNCLTGHIITIIKFNLSKPPPNIKSHSRAPVISLKIRQAAVWKMHFSFFNLRLMSAHVIKRSSSRRTLSFLVGQKTGSSFDTSLRKSEKVLSTWKMFLQIDLRRCGCNERKTQRWTELVDYFYLQKNSPLLGACTWTHVLRRDEMGIFIRMMLRACCEMWNALMLCALQIQYIKFHFLHAQYKLCN